MNARRSILAVAFLLAFAGTTAEAANPALSAVQKTRIDAAKAAFTSVAGNMTTGNGPSADVYAWSVHWYQAEHDAGITTAGADHYTRMVALQTSTSASYTKGLTSLTEKQKVDYYVAEAAVWK